MCGISGIVRRSNSADLSSLIRKVNDTMAHRGPDADAFFVEEEIAFGHRRLSIIDLSTAANQPFVDHSGRFVMVFNGEIYNYEEIKRKINDYPFRTTSDTEVLIAAYAKWGADCLQHLRGMFAFVVWDRQEKELFMARDRMGVKPLYYYHEGDTLVFASEVRAVLASGLMKKELEQNALRDYFSYQSVSYPYSLIKGIVQLEAASWMRWNKNGIERKRYWEVTDKMSGFEFTDPSKVKTRIKELMLQSVGRRLVSDVPVGAFLSGGIDSSIVVGLMAEAANAAPNTFNISFEEEQYDESHYAEIIARKFNTHHNKILLKPTVFLDELQNALGAMDTPSGDGVNTYVVSKAIRNSGMKVAVSGVGGDELFAGYPFFSQYEKIREKEWLWKFPAPLRSSLGTLLQAGFGAGKLGRIAQLLRNDTPGIVDAYPVFRQVLSPSMLKQLTSLSTDDNCPTSLKKDLMARQSQLDALPLLSQVSAADYLGYTQHTLLKDTDQMSMAVSLEVREPFFDQDLVEFVMSIPDELKRPSYPKSLLVESLKPLLPDEVVFRKKKGFTFPWNVWLRNELRSFCETRIDNISQRSFIHGDKLKDLWRSFLAGDKNIRWMEIWLFVVLEYWLEKNDIDG